MGELDELLYLEFLEEEERQREAEEQRREEEEEEQRREEEERQIQEKEKQLEEEAERQREEEEERQREEEKERRQREEDEYDEWIRETEREREEEEERQREEEERQREEEEKLNRRNGKVYFPMYNSEEPIYHAFQEKFRHYKGWKNFEDPIRLRSSDITIMDIAGECGPWINTEKRHFYIACPYCDKPGKKTHLNINVDKDKFRCAMCGITGDIVTLYSILTGCPKDNVKEEVFNRLKERARQNKKRVLIENSVSDADLHDIQIEDILPLCRISAGDRTRKSFYVPCPHCDSTYKRTHLNINLYNNTFRCAKCGISGDVFDFYALFNGCSRQEAVIHVPEQVRAAKKSSLSMEEVPTAGIGTRNKTYAGVLSNLSLASDHLKYLKEKGLEDDQIEKFSYKTTPALGFTLFAKILEREGYTLEGVPGFYLEDGQWRISNCSRGIIIPVRNSKGMIQGLQVIKDDNIVGNITYTWLDSANQTKGCIADNWVHVVGGYSQKMILTIGTLQADIIHEFSDQAVLAIHDLSHIDCLNRVLNLCKLHGLQELRIAFNMSFYKKSENKKALLLLMEQFECKSIEYSIYYWDDHYDGLDEYLHFLFNSHKNSIDGFAQTMHCTSETESKRKKEVIK